MKRYIIITLALALGVISLHAQDTIRDYPTKYPDGLWRLTPDSVSHYRPHNDYSGLNSLLMRLANPFWDGKGYKIPDIGTGLRIEDGKIRPLTTRKESADDPSPVTSFPGSADKSDIAHNPYLEEIQNGVLPFGAPVFIFFRLAGTYVTDSPQILNVNAAADLAIERNLRVRITGAADSATGSPEKNAALAKARAEHVADLMEKRGLPRERIEVVSEGGTANYEPVSANRNCRIELFMQ